MNNLRFAITESLIFSAYILAGFGGFFGALFLAIGAGIALSTGHFAIWAGMLIGLFLWIALARFLIVLILGK